MFGSVSLRTGLVPVGLALLAGLPLLGGCSWGGGTSPGAAATTAAPSSVTGSPVAGPAGVGSPTAGAPDRAVSAVPTRPPVAVPTSVATDPPPATATATGGGVRAVGVVTTSYGWNAAANAVSVRGFVQGAIETGDTCTVTLTSGSTVLTADAPAHPDATTTTCGEIDVRGPQLVPGRWSAVLRYRSVQSAGASAPVQVTVP